MLRLVAVVFALLATWAFAAPPVPADLADSVDVDLRYNNDKFIGPTAKDGAAPIPIYHADVPIVQAGLTRSKFLTAEASGFFIVRHDGQEYVRIFSPSPFPEHPKFIRGAQKYWGVKVTSRATHLVWDPDAPLAKRYYMKLSEHSRTDASVKMSEFLEEHVKDGAAGHHLPERISARVDIDGYRYSNIVREVLPSGVQLGEGEGLYSLHGLIASPYPGKWGGKDKWMQGELMPKLGGWLADLNLHQGVYPESHSQNTMVRVDKATGRVIGFVYRDMHGVAIDPLVRLLHGRRLPDPKLEFSLMNVKHIASQYLMPSELHRYCTQCIFRDQPESAFTAAYRARAEEILGTPLRADAFLDGDVSFPMKMGGLYDRYIEGLHGRGKDGARRLPGTALDATFFQRTRERRVALSGLYDPSEIPKKKYDYYARGHDVEVREQGSGAFVGMIPDVDLCGAGLGGI